MLCFGASAFACNYLFGYYYCTPAFDFRDYRKPEPGEFWATSFEIPVLRNYLYDQRVEVYELRGGQVIGRASMSLNPYDNPGIVVAAYEHLSAIPTPAGTKMDTFLRIVGNLDPAQPATIFAGPLRVLVQGANSVAPVNGSPRETTIRLNERVLSYLNSSYPLTICQRGVCQTVKVQHIPSAQPESGLPPMPPSVGPRG